MHEVNCEINVQLKFLLNFFSGIALFDSVALKLSTALMLRNSVSSAASSGYCPHLIYLMKREIDIKKDRKVVRDNRHK